MRKQYLKGTRKIKLEGLRNIETKYYLVEENREGCGKSGKLFGIEIIKTESDVTESEYTGAISHSKEIVEEILLKLMDNYITPISLIEIVDEIVTLRLCS